MRLCIKFARLFLHASRDRSLPFPILHTMMRGPELVAVAIKNIRTKPILKHVLFASIKIHISGAHHRMLWSGNTKRIKMTSSGPSWQKTCHRRPRSRERHARADQCTHRNSHTRAGAPPAHRVPACRRAGGLRLSSSSSGSTCLYVAMRPSKIPAPCALAKSNVIMARMYMARRNSAAAAGGQVI